MRGRPCNTPQQYNMLESPNLSGLLVDFVFEILPYCPEKMLSLVFDRWHLPYVCALCRPDMYSENFHTEYVVHFNR